MVSKTKNYNKFKEFFNKEYNSLRTYVNSKISETAERDADDIIQDVALKIFSRVDNLLPINNIAGFVYNSIRNKIIDVMRINKQKTYIDDLLNKQLVEFANRIYEKSDELIIQKQINQLKIAISELKPIYQEIILSIDFEGYTYSELSAETQVPKGTLLSRHHRAISILYKQLGNQHEFIY